MSMEATPVSQNGSAPIQRPGRPWGVVLSIACVIVGTFFNVMPRWYLGSWYSRDIGDAICIIGSLVLAWTLPSWIFTKVNRKVHPVALLFVRVFLLVISLVIAWMWSADKACRSGSCI